MLHFEFSEQERGGRGHPKVGGGAGGLEWKHEGGVWTVERCILPTQSEN